MSSPSTNLKFIFGIIFIVLGWIISFNLFLLIIALPLFLIGVVLIILSKKKVLTKIVVIVLPIILWLCIYQIIMYAINKKDNVTIVIPYQFIGQARIVYNEKGGVVPQEVNGEMQLVIPANGILIIRPYFDTNKEHITFVSTDKNNNRYKLNSINSIVNRGTKFPCVYYEGLGSSESLIPNDTSYVGYIYASFYVLQTDTDKVGTFVEEKKNNPLTDSLVKISRKRK